MAGTGEDSIAVDTDALEGDAWSVARLNREIDATLTDAADRFPTYVFGEVSEISAYDFGTFFELRDLEESAVISCIAWSKTLANFDDPLEEGTAAIVRASVDFYADRGDTQLVVSGYWPVGDSDRTQQLEQLRAQLESEGLLDDECKRPLPAYPDCIGLVTSPSGSAREDFVSAVRERYPGVTVKLCGATVQGEEAVPSLVGAIQTLERDRGVDVLVVTRGGGSDTDLWCFNEEPVVRAIADCSTPVVAAVGHEDDRTLSEAVADRRAMTPTDAGVEATPDLESVRESAGLLERRIDGAYSALVDERLTSHERRVEAAKVAVERRVAARRAMCRRASDLETRIDQAYRRRVEGELDGLEARLETAYRDVEADARIEAGTAEARRLRIVVAVLLALLVLGTVLVVVLLL